MSTMRIATKLSDDVQIGKNGFDCGNSTINEQIRESYYSTLLQHMYAYKITMDDRVVGDYMLHFQSVIISALPGELADRFSDMTHGLCYALCLKYIAIDKPYQNRRIGQRALLLIIANAQNLSKNWPIRFLTIDALAEKVGWYTKNGFKAFGSSADDGPTIKMYLDLHNDPERLERYCNKQLEA